ncbi:AcrR family transcriptional regulator [Actinomadura coerulea]|uniref:AcrR family transcriptional regulator n=1 Tax=Actinomadura coerulea TaxID=46159 RepID=A0A7X0FYC0_9ACTN|nr:TetR/AcrR family transcriptional regulator [Actinomadura coerulea]MBB6395066.1 AcrR family transcriptional regulator [Actinomadura coerulea]GGQ14554.1 TetR family transcriptional regulator [Actinomadura coerulea]
MAGGEQHVSIWSIPERQGRGPRPAFSRAQITEAAIRIADAEGLEAASMRRIAADLGTGAMSLYRYVPSRDDLVDLMADHVLLEMGIPERPSGDWRADLTLVAENTRAVWLRHTWLAGLRRPRATLGPNRLRLVEFAFGALDVGVPIDDMLTLLEILNGYVEYAVRGEIEWVREMRQSGMTPERWMTRSAPYVRELLDSGRYPMFERVVRDARMPHMSGEEQFRCGLGRVLDCIAGALPDPS